MSKTNIIITVVVGILAAAGVVGYFVTTGPRTEEEICIQVISPAKHPLTGEVRDFPTPCDVPWWWQKVEGEAVIGGPSSEPLLAEPNAIYVADQKPGREVTVSFVLMAEAGFVVIHEADADGNPGAILGSSAYLAVGEYSQSDVVIKLSRESRDGEVLLAMLHQDNGDATFSEGEDAAVASQFGGVISMVFFVSSEATESGEVSL